MATRWWRPVTDAQVCMLALATVMGVWSVGRWWLLVLAACSFIAILRLVDVRLRRDLVVATLVLLALGGVLSVRSWSGAHPRTLGTYQGWATLESDPASFGPGVKVVVEVEGQRFEATVYGAGRRRLLERQAGERVEVVGERKVATGVVGATGTGTTHRR